MNELTAHCLMIGLDAADPRILFRAMDAGQLPHLAELALRGHRRLLHNAGEYSDDSVWASFCFGQSPQQHGRHHYRMQLDSGNYGMAVTEESGRDTFWWKLSEAGATVAVVDIPKCPTPVPINGVHLADWLVHGKYRRQPVSYPAGLAAQIIRDHGGPPPSKCGYMQEVTSDSALLEFHQNLQSSIRQKRAAGLELISRKHWDFYAIGFKEAHCAGHHFWHLAERHHMHSVQPVNNRLGDLLMDIYISLDAAVGDIVAAAGESANVIVFTGSSITSNGSLNHLGQQLEAKLTDELVRNFGGLLNKVSHLSGIAMTWLQRNRCVLLPSNDNLLAFRIMTSESTEHARATDYVETLLRSLQDPETDLPPFTLISRPAPNDRRSWADVVVHCRPGYVPSTLKSPLLGTMTAPVGAIRTGNHVGGGCYIAYGKQANKYAQRIGFVHEFAKAAEAIVGNPSPNIAETELTEYPQKQFIK